VEKLERAAFGLNFSDEKKRRRKKTSKILYTSQLIIGIFSDTTLLLPIIIQRYSPKVLEEKGSQQDEHYISFIIHFQDRTTFFFDMVITKEVTMITKESSV